MHCRTGHDGSWWWIRGCGESLRRRSKPAQVFGASAAAGLVGGEGREGDQVFPGFIFGDVEEAGVDGAFAIGLGVDEETVGLADLPVVIEEGLSAGAFVAEPADADFFILVQQLDALILGDCFRIVL